MEQNTVILPIIFDLKFTSKLSSFQIDLFTKLDFDWIDIVVDEKQILEPNTQNPISNQLHNVKFQSRWPFRYGYFDDWFADFFKIPQKCNDVRVSKKVKGKIIALIFENGQKGSYLVNYKGSKYEEIIDAKILFGDPSYIRKFVRKFKKLRQKHNK